MTRRIVSGVFLLIALGVLGVIIAGALTSGEQLIVRFLTAIIVAALAMYVISDLRLQANDTAVAGTRATVPAPRITSSDEHPPNSTAAFMATVTGKRSNGASRPISADQFNTDAELLGLANEAKAERAASGTKASAPSTRNLRGVSSTRRLQGEDMVSRVARPAPVHAGPEESPYAADVDEASLWPFNDTADEISDQDLAELDDVDGLVAMFTKQTEQELSEKRTLTMAGSTVGSVATNDARLLPGPGPDLSGTNLGSRPDYRPTIGHGEQDGHSGHGDDLAFGSGDQSVQDDVGNDNLLTTKGDGPTTPIVDLTDGVDTTTSGEELALAGDTPVRDDSSLADDTSLTGDTALTGDAALTDETGLVDETGLADEAAPDGGTSPDGGAAPAEDAGDPADDFGPVAQQAPVTAEAPVAMPALPAPARVAATDYADSGIAPIIDLRTAAAGSNSSNVDTAIQSGEYGVVASLIEQGLLTTDGPITDRDVRTMVYVAFTSSELRKILLAGGTIDGDNSDIELGEVDVFDPAIEAGPIQTSQAL